MIRPACRRVALVAVLGGALAIACETTPPEAEPEIDARTRARVARQALQDGRALYTEARYEAAERVLRRGLRMEPENATLERALAQALDAQGRTQEAAAARERADRFDPPAPPLPSEPLRVARGATVIALVESTRGIRPEEPGRWPEPAVERALRAHLRRRLPDAIFQHAEPASTPSAEHWLEERDAARVLSLRVERADCRYSVKDGAIAVAELRYGVAAAAEAARTGEVRVVLEDPPDGDACTRNAVQRALEQVLATPAWRRVAEATPDPEAARWNRSALPELFPGISRHAERALRRGRSFLNAGRLTEARHAFLEAARIDPTSPTVLAFVDDAERSLALARELAREGGGDPGSLDPRLSPAQRAAAQIALERERRRRDELLAALAVLDEDVRAPPTALLAKLRPVEIGAPEAFGPTLARKRASGRRVEARAAYAPDGEVLARYYFAPGEDAPLLREEDTDGNGVPDRWIAYSGAARREIFEDGSGRGRPDLHLVFAEGGEPLERIELDLSGDERPERVFRYIAGRLRAESSDTDGDGILDRFDRFDAAGLVDVREEDLDGDGAIDIRSEFRAGKLVRREVADPEYVPES